MAHHLPPSQSKRRSRRGAVLVEYSLVLVLVAIPAIAGILSGGRAMLAEYRLNRDALLRSNP